MAHGVSKAYNISGTIKINLSIWMSVISYITLYINGVQTLWCPFKHGDIKEQPNLQQTFKRCHVRTG